MKNKVYDYVVLVEQDEDGIYVAKAPDIPGCYTQGKTVEQAMERIREAIQVCVESGGEEIVPMRFVGLQHVLMGQKMASPS
ncbi:MAG: hypothetical protein MSIBF_03670 [Candidatus Altiarchaeales archaeon IMC4]|nr:MAG: hypothetical protein MSIBF_03670 [Candidatus Altiarchaeales archaeon IMC4]